MRPKIIALLAVSAIALVGCSAGDPSNAPGSSPRETAVQVPTPSATPKELSIEELSSLEPELDPSPSSPADVAEAERKQAEKNFVNFADIRSGAHAAKVNKDSKEIVDQLHAFCDSGEPIDVSSTDSLNENLEIVAEDSYCEAVYAD